MSISTRRGDGGRTSLGDGTDVSKADPRIETLGSLDELTSWLGVIKHSLPAPLAGAITEIQQTLIRLAGEVALNGKGIKNPLLPADVEKLEQRILEQEKGFNLTRFIIPGATRAAAEIDICRTITRRAERHLTSASELMPVSPLLYQYLNRLSDLLFLLAHAKKNDER